MRRHYITIALWICAALPMAAAFSKTGEHIMHATGPFEVKLNPLDAYNKDLGRMTIDKQFHGDLEATSQGEMLSFRDASKQSGGYVAMERVSGTLGGRKGTFVLQHSSTMDRGQPTQNIFVVPQSGTGELSGLRGSLVVNIAADGAHSYDFQYTLEPAN